MIIFFSVFSRITLVYFYNLGHVRKSFFSYSRICLPHKFVSSVGASAMFCLVWAMGVSHWGTTGEIIMLELITNGQVGSRFQNSLLCKISCNARKSYEHSKSFLLISDSTFRCFRNWLSLGASSCGFLPSEKHVILIGGSVQCLFVPPTMVSFNTLL